MNHNHMVDLQIQAQEIVKSSPSYVYLKNPPNVLDQRITTTCNALQGT